MAETLKCPECGTDLPPNAVGGICPKCMLKVGLGSEADAGGAKSEGAKSPPPTPAELAKHFPQLEILELLGQGGMGVVYKARQPRLDRLVALKILPAEAGRDQAFAERFTREARALARLAHPNIVAVHDFGEANGIYFFVMEYVDGLNLRQLEQSGQFSPREALKIVPAICEALQYAHDQGIVHRDVKPENILMDKQGRVKIADFGLAKLLGLAAQDLTLTEARQVMGTPHYMAPEQIEHPQDVDHRADIYSLGVVFYEMLTGELPLGKFAPPSSRVRGMQVDVRLDEVVLRALEKERERRYQRVSEVKTDVETIATSAPQRTPPPPAVSSPAALAYESARQTVRGPAIGLLVTGILNWVLIPFYLLIGVYALAAQDSALSGNFFLLALVLIFVASSLMILASLRMKALEAYWLAVAGSILAILVTPGNLIGLPIGIWALAILSRRSVRRAFGKEARPAAVGPGGTVIVPPGAVVPSGAQGSTASRALMVTATVVLAGLALLLLLALLGLGAWIFLPALSRAKMHAQSKAHVESTIVRGEPATAESGMVEASAVQESVEVSLRRDAARHLAEAGVRYRAINMSLLDGSTGTCRFVGLQERKDVGGTNVWTDIAGWLEFRREQAGRWQCQGQEQLGHIEFTVESGVKAVPQVEPPPEPGGIQSQDVP